MQENNEEFDEDFDEEDEKAPSAMTPAGKLTFVRDGHELSSALKYLTKASKMALVRLKAATRSEDERIALDASKSILDFHVKIATEINKDALQRTLLEIKHNQTQQGIKQVGHEEETQRRPLVNFNDIQDVS